MNCHNCGETNQPGAIFCRKCGGRLLPEHVLAREEKKRLRESEERLSGHKRIHFLRYLIPLAFFIYVFYLIIQNPVLPRNLNINERYAEKFETKLLRLHEHYNNRKLYRIAITEDELNSFLKLNTFATNADLFNIFLDDGLTIFINRSILGKTIRLKIYCGIQIKNGLIMPEILNVRLGKLPVPSFIVRFVVDKLLTSKFSNELACPPYITGFEFSENIMYIIYDPNYNDKKSSLPASDDVDQLLMQANKLYKDQELNAALKLYNQIIADYPDDPRIPALKKWCEDISARINK
ncbi:MAG: zinc ribbon domain-containing protein [Candidatus Auribacterota bacterium]|jgi:uncharacterized protein YpmS|uniref:Zinc ribbon domain-containing protein n=1 Tax=Candidatus Auribacter fodinae TaxID=2093366 RepID=A0A3A4R962_9BACT|nr:MAG: zinc ribbon domain-containing protein [Candidatus Auribacter fodinae]